jgi:UPF0716 family protein affecting phage T7 exclusion
MKILTVFLLAILTLSPGITTAEQEPLGRLFLTPQQRATLDRQRQQNTNFQANEASQTFNGEIRRSNGSSIRWVNGEANWNTTGAKQNMAVGDTYHPGTGERQSLLGSGGSITIKPGGSAK